MGVGVTYAAVPLYRMFCAATGFAGTPKVGMGKFEADRLVPVDDARRIKVHFNADVSDALPWSFVPQQRYVSVLPGETSLAFYKAKNKSKNDIIGIATYNVTPDRVRECLLLWTNQELTTVLRSRLHHTSQKSNVSASRSNVSSQAKKSTCLFSSSLTETCSTTQHAATLRILSFLTHSSGTFGIKRFAFRNLSDGHLL